MGLACLICQRPVAHNSFGECCGFSPPITHRTEAAEGLRVKCETCGWWQDEGNKYDECEQCGNKVLSLDAVLWRVAWREGA